MPEKEVKIGKKIFGENTEVTVTMKTLFWILNILVFVVGTAFGIMYFDIKKELASYKEKMKTEAESSVKDVKTDVKDITRDISDMKINIGIILDRTSGVRSPSIGITPSNNIPTPLITGQDSSQFHSTL